MTESQILSKVKLRKVYQELNDFFYKKEKINIAVESSIKKKKYKDFKESINKTLITQVKTFTKEKNIQSVLDNLQKIKKRDLVLAIAAIFLSFSDVYDDEKQLSSFLTWSAIVGGVDALTKMGATSIDFSPTSEKSLAIIKERADFLPVKLDQTTMEWVASLIDAGIKDQQSAIEIAKEIEKSMEEMADYRSEIIAEQELVNMIGQFNYETFIENGVTEYRWVTAGDEKTCEICSGNENQGWIPISKYFNSGVSFPPAHIACRCYIEPNKKVSGRVWRG